MHGGDGDARTRVVSEGAAGDVCRACPELPVDDERTRRTEVLDTGLSVSSAFLDPRHLVRPPPGRRGANHHHGATFHTLSHYRRMSACGRFQPPDASAELGPLQTLVCDVAC